MYKQLVSKKYAAVVYLIPVFCSALFILALCEYLPLSYFFYTMLQSAVVLASFVGLYAAYLRAKTQFAYYYFSDELVFKQIRKNGAKLLLSVPTAQIRGIRPIRKRERWGQKIPCVANYSSSMSRAGKYYVVWACPEGLCKACFEPDSTMLGNLERLIARNQKEDGQ